MKFRNVTKYDLDVPAHGVRAAAGAEVEVTGDAAKALAASPDFERVDAPAQRGKADEKSDQ